MRRDRQDGYVLFGIAIGLVILGISMTAAVPLWQKIVQREREKELIFRGYQYMQAIELYQRKYPGAYPPNIDILIEEKFLREEYKDPFAESEDGSFRIIRQLSPELQQGAQQQRDAAARAAGISDLNRSQAQLGTPGQPTSGSTRAPAGGQFQSTMGRSGSDQSMGGIVGVASVGEEETFYKVPGKEKYKDWLFVYGAQQQAGRPMVPGQPGAQPGVPGAQPGVPGGQPGLPGQIGGAAPQSPFPGLPPPPGLTQFRFGSTPGAAGQPGTGAPPGQPPGQILPGQPGSTATPGPSSFGQPPGSTGSGQQRPQNPRRQP